jgi:hypothetical protein
MIKDTVGMFYYFLDKESKYNASVNKVDHDYSKSLSGGPSLLNSVAMDGTLSIEERTRVETCYVEGMGGPATEIYLTDDMFDELIELEKASGEEFSKFGINQCLFTIYIEGASYDWEVTQSRVDYLTPTLDKSFTRLGAYLNYNTLSPVLDYDYVYENTYNTETIYGGFLDRSRGCYVLNITAHMQRLFNYAKSVRQEDGSYAFNEEDKNYIRRTIYLGTEATSPYSLSECVLQGIGNTLEAPIQIDLTYTLVK